MNIFQRIEEAESLWDAQEEEQDINVGMFSIQTMNSTIRKARKRPIPQSLFKNIWYEGELCCLFSDSNLGKSILAVQIAEDIAEKGKRVLYFDFELSDKQIELRYTNEESKEPYIFSPNIFRVEISEILTDDFEENLIQSIEDAIFQMSAEIVIIDNITYLCSSAEKGDSAVRLMRKLKELKKRTNVSMLILAHTPKRNTAFPLTPNDLAGSRNLFNFFDSVFSIGRSAKDENLRYIKQLKCRNGEFSYGADNVIVCEIVKDFGFLKFSEVGYDVEKEHLKEKTEQEEEILKNQVKLRLMHGMSIRQIATELGISSSKVQRIKKKSG